jgi:hypothetical protein
MTRPRHDLDAILVDALQRFGRLSCRVEVAWVDLDAVDRADFDEHADLAAVVWRDGVACVGVHPRLRRAPRYVLLYLVCHELLHIALGCEGHPIAFAVAERLLPSYAKACAWLDSRADAC